MFLELVVVRRGLHGGNVSMTRGYIIELYCPLRAKSLASLQLKCRSFPRVTELRSRSLLLQLLTYERYPVAERTVCFKVGWLRDWN
jgi:hypothetical protein